jgi:hypothetical protein
MNVYCFWMVHLPLFYEPWWLFSCFLLVFKLYAIYLGVSARLFE